MYGKMVCVGVGKMICVERMVCAVCIRGTSSTCARVHTHTHIHTQVKHLLQQARSRGSVSLIIASHSSQHEGGMKGGGELQARLPEGVKLRNKKKKPSKRTAVQRGLILQSRQDPSGLASFPGLFK